MDMLTFLGFGVGMGSQELSGPWSLEGVGSLGALSAVFKQRSQWHLERKVLFHGLLFLAPPGRSPSMEHVATQTLLSAHIHTPCRTV